MNDNAKKIYKALAAMSGGVDSTVAAMLLLRDGKDCAGATMKLFPGDDNAEADAHAAALRLNMPFHVFDFSESFADKVIDHFIHAYSDAQTPNPCVVCNKHIKFGRFLDQALELGYDHIATGHYARVDRDASGRYLLKKGLDETKDQSYVLYTLTQTQLSRTLFPLGGLSKVEVKELAHGAGFENLQRRESQDICFVQGGDYSKFIAEYTGAEPIKGRFIDVEGNDLGENRGVVCYTIGQRRGLGLAMPHPSYVLELRPEDNTVVVGRRELLYSKALYARSVNLIPFDMLNSPIRACVKIRYNQTGQPAMVYQEGADLLRIDFDEPQRAITKGQAAVIYDGDVVLGGGTIESAEI